MTRRLKPAAERFWSKVDKSGDCWTWTGWLHRHGYGGFTDGDPINGWRNVYAHRWAYESTVGPIPDDREIDHLCRNRQCVRPEHLEVVTHQQNQERAGIHRRGRLYNVGTHCRRGHERNDENTRITRQGNRYCRICSRLNMRESRARRATVTQ